MSAAPINITITVCAICGVLCISLPIPIIVNNFNKFYEKSKIEEEILLKKTQSSWEEAKRGIKSIIAVNETVVEWRSALWLDFFSQQAMLQYQIKP